MEFLAHGRRTGEQKNEDGGFVQKRRSGSRGSGGRLARRISECLFLWTTGGCCYYVIEIMFRGFSHWSMFVVGGLVLVFCAFQGQAMHWTEGLWIQVLRGVTMVAALEFITGIIVNKWFHLAVWDYSDQPLNLWGQICVPFLVLFAGLVLLAILIGGTLLHRIYGEPKPHFHVL